MLIIGSIHAKLELTCTYTHTVHVHMCILNLCTPTCTPDSDVSLIRLTLGLLDDTSHLGRKGCVFEEQAGVD